MTTARNLWLVLLIPMFCLSACGPAKLFGPTITPSPTNTLTPTHTVTPSLTNTLTRTPTPTHTRTLVPSLTLTETRSLPSDPPLTEFHHIPIMPGAIAGEVIGEDGWYHYIIKTSQEKVTTFYVSELPLHGWQVDGVSDNDKGGYIIYRVKALDFIYLYQEGDITDVLIMLSSCSPSRDKCLGE